MFIRGQLVQFVAGHNRGAAKLAAQFLLLACLFAGYHFGLQWLMLHAGLKLGAVRPSDKVYRFVPLYGYWEPHLKTGLLVAVAVIAGWLWYFCRWIWLARTHLAVVLPALMIAHVLIASSVAMIDGGPRRLWRPYELLDGTDYIGAVAKVDSLKAFLSDYPSLMPELPMHCRTHPPGGVLFLWAVALLFGDGPVPAAWATIFGSSLMVPAVYLLARNVLDEQSARLASSFFILSPSIVMFSATLLDAVFGVPIVWSAYFLWKARGGRPLVYGALGGAAAAIAAGMTFSASFLALWAVVVLALTALAEQCRIRNSLLGMTAAVATSAVLYAALYAWSGYDAWATFAEAMAGQSKIMAGRGHDSLRQDLHFAVANLVAFSFCAGLPLATLWLRRIGHLLLGVDKDAGDRLLAGSFLVSLTIFAAAPLYTLEVEHIWLFLVPFVAIGAAAVAERDSNDGQGHAIAVTSLVLLAVQTVLMEVFLETTW